MTYIEWITIAEKMSVLDYRRLPEDRKNRIRANYAEYCETFNLVQQKVKI
jgi:hypothetical protein